LVVEPFAGPGGLSEGLRLAGWTGRSLGVEWDQAACVTAAGAGHWRVRADAARFSLDRLRGRVDGVAGGPPCPPWSATGKRLGLLDQGAVLERIDAFAAGRRPAEVTWHDERSPLCAEPMRYVVALRPRWVVLEQVPAVLPLWRHVAALLDRMGYSTWTGILSSEEYGVPQTRRRAVLLASLDRPAARPTPTHQRYRKGQPPAGNLLVRPWVSIREALGWTGDGVIVSNYGTGGDARDRGERSFGEPAATITTKAGRSWVTLRNNNTANACERRIDEPSGTLYFGRRSNAVEFHTTDGERRRVTVEEAALLQSFPAGYRFHGGQSKAYEQIGNAVPPLLARALFDAVLPTSAAAAA
jgi:DNA (cytosine-5)-methyltransferase 1